jgi:hypothetical protein
MRANLQNWDALWNGAVKIQIPYLWKRPGAGWPRNEHPALCPSYGAFAGGMAVSPGPGRTAALDLAEWWIGGWPIALRFALSL